MGDPQNSLFMMGDSLNNMDDLRVPPWIGDLHRLWDTVIQKISYFGNGLFIVSLLVAWCAI